MKQVFFKIEQLYYTCTKTCFTNQSHKVKMNVTRGTLISATFDFMSANWTLFDYITYYLLYFFVKDEEQCIQFIRSNARVYDVSFAKLHIYRKFPRTVHNLTRYNNSQCIKGATQRWY